MMPSTHFLESWLLANAIPCERRGRLAIALSGVLPDLDGLGYPIEALTRGSSLQLFWFEDFHHVLLHNACAGLFFATLSYFLCGRSWRVALGSLAAFHLHLLCDLLGSAGEGGELWPIFYFLPFSGYEINWQGQWRLDSPINIAITFLCEIATAYLAWRRGFSPLELLSPKLDAKLMAGVYRLFGRPFSP